VTELFPFVKDDGGREFAGYKGMADDCTCRAIAIATGEDYETVYRALWDIVKRKRAAGDKECAKVSPRTGVPRSVYDEYLTSLGWEWFPTMQVGSTKRIHVRPDELPNEDMVLRLSKHMTAVLDGELHDTYDPSRDGTRLVYGYYVHTNGATARRRWAERQRDAENRAAS
jgi:hypothetical protein